MSDKEGEVTFKVTDRRLFNPDGTLRAEIVEQEQTSTPTTAPLVEEATPSPPAIETSPLFVELLVNLISSAEINLGMLEHPALGKRIVDLSAAKQMIDWLGALREKTRGNLSREEEELFDGALTQLRMRFVQLANRQPREREAGA
ncbi:MAG: DUF1844 domain-containing protein [Blastocatellia bacterium]|nr:DUF1844 domain-containing protein [Blastocatellia bacterium]MCS7157076.1 DUF1844 domain-containing protein [Blastocatellia bacterium]MCX7752277.1 DUF1844 domain-containing protein [Blastocatellia bacterium]MDW8167769.1 DUF1844 domain-containing protein [Acidobacteriota bacterium]MDW8256590.1 DUF1844 domain-containing protein [Acidobacteriota bacterium]